MLLLTKTDDYTLELAGHRYGFSDWTVSGWGETSEFTKIELGPLGQHHVPVSGQAGWGIVVFMLVLAIGVASILRPRKNSS